jgi:hypothetical protein
MDARGDAIQAPAPAGPRAGDRGGAHRGRERAGDRGDRPPGGPADALPRLRPHDAVDLRPLAAQLAAPRCPGDPRRAALRGAPDRLPGLRGDRRGGALGAAGLALHQVLREHLRLPRPRRAKDGRRPARAHRLGDGRPHGRAGGRRGPRGRPRCPGRPAPDRGRRGRLPQGPPLPAVRGLPRHRTDRLGPPGALEGHPGGLLLGARARAGHGGSRRCRWTCTAPGPG